MLLCNMYVRVSDVVSLFQPSLLATESLTFISIRKLEEWFKRELRDMGGLDLIVQMGKSVYF